MRGRRQGKQTKRRHAIRWSRFLPFLAMLVAILAILLVMIMLLGDGGMRPNTAALPSASPAPVVLPSAGTPSPQPSATLPPGVALAPIEGVSPQDGGFTTELEVARETVTSFARSPAVQFGGRRSYSSIPGLLTFGGNQYRDTFTYGTQALDTAVLARIWEKPLGRKSAENREELGSFSGAGWTGMPLLIEWPAEVRAVLGIQEEYRAMEGFVEVIYPAQDGYIYFLELTSGNATREPLSTGVITSGTAALDPRGYPLLYVGQSIPHTVDGVYGSWVRAYDLIKNEEVWSFGGKDPFSHRDWQGFTGSPLIDANTDTLLIAGENGVLYSTKLNSAFDAAAGTVSIAPGGLEKYRYTATGYALRVERGTRLVSMKSSIAMVGGYAFFTDSGGMLQCVDMNTLQLQYAVDVTDESIATPVIEEDGANGTFYIYTGSTIARQAGDGDTGICHHRKIDGRTGRIIWQKEYTAAFSDTSSNPGTVSTAHAGRNSIADIVIFNTTLMPVTYEQGGAQQEGRGGWIIAYSKETGEELWRQQQPNNYWSSPVVLYAEDGAAVLVQGDRDGKLRMYEPRTGAQLYELDVGSAIDSTPAVFGNYLVLGTNGQYGTGEGAKIIGVRIGTSN